MKSKEVKWIYDTYGGLSMYLPLEDALETITEAIEAQDRGEWEELRIRKDEDDCVIITGRRPETDLERQTRLDNEQSAELQERKQYELLKKKFEGK